MVPALSVIWAGDRPQIERMKVFEYCFRLRCDHFHFSAFILISSFVCIFGIELIFFLCKGRTKLANSASHMAVGSNIFFT